VLPKQREAEKLLITEGGPQLRPQLNSWKNSEKEIEVSMKTNITPLHDRVIVKRIDEGEQVRGGIIIPDSAKEKPQEGEVIAAGEGKYKEDGTRQPLDVKKGDRILFGKYTSSEIKIDGEELLIMREDEILGIITRAGAAAGGKKSAR
jgi:chaperonin GroES